MVKYPEFDKREKFGTSIKGSVPPSNRVARTPEDRIAEGDQTGPAPLEHVAFARDQIFKEFDAPARAPHILKRHASRLRSEYGP